MNAGAAVVCGQFSLGLCCHLHIPCFLQGGKDMKDDESKLNFLNDALNKEWPEEPPVWRDDVLKALKWRASVSHAAARGVCPVLVFFFLVICACCRCKRADYC